MAIDRMWYTAAKGDAHGAVFQQVRYIARQQLELREDMLFYLDLYSAGNVAGLGSVSTLPAERISEYMYRARTGATRFNLIAAMVDTAASLISQSPSIPQYLTTDGDFKLIRRAEKATQILQGQFNRDVQGECRRAQMFAYKTGTGFLHVYVDEETGVPVAEAVSPLEVYVEHLDGWNPKNTRSMHRRRILAKETVKAYFPGDSAAIETCQGLTTDPYNSLVLQGLEGATYSAHDFVEVVESWHLKKGKQKGRHTICIPNATLVDEAYQAGSFPLVAFRYRVRDHGYYGAGLAESGCDAQNRINDLILKNMRSQDLASNLVLLNPSGSGVTNEQLTNELGLILNYDPGYGTPQAVKWEGTLTDIQAQIDLEFQRALMVEGLAGSQVSGDGVGTGSESGVAKRAADDIQSRRLVDYVNRFQNACIDVAKQIERLNDELARSDKNYSLSVAARAGTATFLKTAKWADVRVDARDARLTMMPMSAMPTTPMAKWAACMDWIQGGFISRPYAMSLLQFPDIDAYASIDLAHLDMAKWQVEQILDLEDDDQAVPPHPNPRQDLSLALDLMTKCQLKAEMMKAPEYVLQAFETFMTECEDLMQMAQPAPAAQPAVPAGPGMIGGLPTAPVAPGMSAAPGA